MVECNIRKMKLTLNHTYSSSLLLLDDNFLSMPKKLDEKNIHFFKKNQQNSRNSLLGNLKYSKAY